MFLHKISPVAPPLWLAADELEMPPANLGKILLYALHKSANAFASNLSKACDFRRNSAVFYAEARQG